MPTRRIDPVAASLHADLDTENCQMQPGCYLWAALPERSGRKANLMMEGFRSPFI